MENAFASMDLLGHRHGINGMMPPELMHILLSSGLLAYCLAMFFAQVTNAVQLAIDRFVDEYIVPHRFSRRADYPRCNFAKGYCNLKEITAEEVAGKAFVWTIIQAMPWAKNLKQQFARNRSNLFRRRGLHEDSESAEEKESNREDQDQDSDHEIDSHTRHNLATQQKVGEQPHPVGLEEATVDDESVASERPTTESLGQQHKSPQQSGHNKMKNKAKSTLLEEPPLREVSCTEFANVAATLLMLHSWYKDGHDIPIVNAEEEEGGVDPWEKLFGLLCATLKMLLTVMPRRLGSGWSITKFHELLAVGWACVEFGHPSNYEASTGERDLKYFAKEAGINARKGDVNQFTDSTAVSMHRKLCLRKASRHLGLDDEDFEAVTTSDDQEPGDVGECTLDTETDVVGSIATTARPTFFLVFGNDGTADEQPRVEVDYLQKRRKGNVLPHPLIIDHF